MTGVRPLVVASLVLTLVATSAHAYTCVEIGVDSDLLVFDGKVLFSQADGTLTLLNLQTGKVLHRGKDRHEIRRFAITPHGILGGGFYHVILLDRDTMAVRWAADCKGQPVPAGESVICKDANGSVACRRIADGCQVWSTFIGTEPQCVADGNRVLITNARYRT